MKTSGVHGRRLAAVELPNWRSPLGDNSPGQTKSPQLPDIQVELQKANAIASLQLLRMFRVHNNEKEVARICGDLRDLMRRIRLLLDCFDGTAKTGHSEPRILQVVVGLQCDNCLEPHYSPHRREPSVILAQTKHALTLITRITDSVFVGGPELSQDLIARIASLRKLFVRERRRFLEIERNCVPRVEVIVRKDPYCMFCGAEVPMMEKEGSV